MSEPDHDHVRRLVRALDRMDDDLRRWVDAWGEGENWLRSAEIALKQIRGEFHAAVSPVFRAARAEELDWRLRNVLHAINEELTDVGFVKGPDDPPGPAYGAVDEQGRAPEHDEPEPSGAGGETAVDARTAEPRRALDALIEGLPTLRELAVDNVWPDEEWAFMDQAVDTAANIRGVAIRLRDELTDGASTPLRTMATGEEGNEAGPSQPEQRREQVSVGSTDQPDEKGFVADPSDPSAYIPLTDLLNREDTLNAGFHTAKILRRTLDKNVQIRRYRPGGHPQRLSVHLGDWYRFLNQRSNDAAAEVLDPNPEEIARRKGLLRRAGD